MPERDRAVDLVAEDVQAGMGRWFTASTADNGGFHLLDQFDGAFVNDVDGSVAVAWEWVGRHDNEAMGMLPTDRDVTVRGVTLVRDTDDGERFTRFIDWLGALAQIGVGLHTRPIVDAGEPDPTIV